MIIIIIIIITIIIIIIIIIRNAFGENLAQKDYKKRHEKLGLHIHCLLCCKYGIECSKNWYKHKAKSIEKNEKSKILWDVTIQRDRAIEARRPDIVVIVKANKTCQIIDIAVPSDQNIAKKEKEKIDKYQELKLEIMRM